MVEANPIEGDGVVRNTLYAKFREDKPVSPGYSAELISVHIEPGFEENLEGQKLFKEGPKTLMECFKR